MVLLSLPAASVRKPDQIIAGSVNLLFMPDMQLALKGNIPADVTYYRLCSYDGSNAMHYVLRWACERYPFFRKLHTIRDGEIVTVDDQTGYRHYLRRDDGYKKIATVTGLGSFIVVDLRDRS